MLVVRGPQFVAFRVPHPPGLPDVDSDLARMLRVLGDDPPAAGVAGLGDPAEREALFMSLATTLTRATYHRRRFEESISHLVERRTQVGATVSSDTCSKFPMFEASAFLTAARTVVDEVLFVAARRSGVPPTNATQWTVNAAMTCSLTRFPEYNVSEVLRLRAHSAWYEEMNEYRNVLVHRGWREQLGGYYPEGMSLAEASDPSRNVLLMPDRSSLGRANRAHQWTYGDGTRLEHVVERSGDGLSAFLQDVAQTSWGGAVPARGTAPAEKLPNIFVHLPHAGLVFAGEIVSPLFTSPERAQNFQRTAYRGDPNVELIELRPTLLNDGTSLPEPGFWMSVPSGVPLREALALAGATSGDLVLTLDPVLQTNGAVAGQEIARFPVADLLDVDAAGLLAKLPQDHLAGAQRLYIWRRP